MRVLEKNNINDQEPEVLDDATLAVIDKAERWELGKKSITFDEALARARKRNLAWRNADQDLPT